jgi:hypothetical protein
MGSVGKRLLDRMDSFWTAKPRRATTTVLVLTVVIMITLLAILAQSVDFRKVLPFLSPYESDDDSPLSLAENGVKASGFNVLLGNSSLRYGNLKFYFGEEHGGSFGTVANAPELANLSSGVPVQVRRNTSGVSLEDGSIDWNYLLISDAKGDGTFDDGDSITFVFAMTEPLAEDTVHVIAIHCLQDGFGYGWEYSLAIHDGKLYSWRSDTLNNQQPWWDF